MLLSAPFAPTGFSLLSTEEARLSLALFGCFAPFGGTTSPSSTSYTFLFFFTSRQGSTPTVVTGRGGGGEIGRNLGLGDLLGRCPFVPPSKEALQSSPRVDVRLLIFLGTTIYASDYEPREWVAECLSNSSSESGSWIIGSTRSSLSSSK